VVVVSQALWKRAEGIGIPLERLALIPSGCDHQRIQVCDQTECRNLLNLPQKVPLLCFAGFAFWDFQFLLEAMQMVLAQFPKTHLIVIGEDKDGQISQLIRTVLGNSTDSSPGQGASQVHLLGRFPPEQMSIPLGAAEIHLLPLPDNPINQARWPIKFGDYLASGRPIVASRVGDAVGWLERAQAGRVTAPSPAGMASGIIRLLEDPGTAHQMGRNGRSLAEGELSWEAMTTKLLEFYQSVLSR
jgi:glycosyltransferase involved in cell wall biosynthesis